MQKQFSVILQDDILLRTRTVSFLSRTFQDGIKRLKQEGRMGEREMIVGSSVIAALSVANLATLPRKNWFHRLFGISPK